MNEKTSTQRRRKMFMSPLSMLKKKPGISDLGYDYLDDDDGTTCSGDYMLGIEPSGGMMGRSDAEVDYKDAFRFECDWDSDTSEEQSVIVANSIPKRRKSKRHQPRRQLEAVQLVIQEPSMVTEPHFCSFEERAAAAAERSPLPNARERHTFGLARREPTPSPDRSAASSTFSAVASYFPQPRKGRSPEALAPAAANAHETDSDTSCTVDTEDDSFEANTNSLPKIRRTIRFADEAGLPIETVHLTEGDDEEEDLDWTRIIVLLLSPKKRKFEFIHLTYNVTERTPLCDALKQFPSMATDPSLTHQKYVGLCRPSKDGIELINSLSLQDYDLEKDEILLAILSGMNAKQLVEMSQPLLADRTVIKMVKRKKRIGFAVQKVQQRTEDTTEPRTVEEREHKTGENNTAQTVLASTSRKNNATDANDTETEDTPREDDVTDENDAETPLEHDMTDEHDAEIEKTPAPASSLVDQAEDVDEQGSVEDSGTTAPPMVLSSTRQENEATLESDEEIGEAPDKGGVMDENDTKIEKTLPPAASLNYEAEDVDALFSNTALAARRGTGLFVSKRLCPLVEQKEDETRRAALPSTPKENDASDESEQEIEEMSPAASPLGRENDEDESVEKISACQEAKSAPNAETAGGNVRSGNVASDDNTLEEEMVEVPVTSGGRGKVAAEERNHVAEELEEIPDILSCAAADTEPLLGGKVKIPVLSTKTRTIASVRRIAGGSWVPKSDGTDGDTQDEFDIEVEGIDEVPNMDETKDSRESMPRRRDEDKSSTFLFHILLGFLLQMVSGGKRTSRPRKTKKDKKTTTKVK